MRRYFLSTILLFTLSCASGPSQNPDASASDNAKSDVALFLSTRSAEVEAKALDRLKLHNVSHSDLKAILLGMLNGRTGPTGLHLNMEIEHNGNKYPYAIFAPEPLVPGTSYPMIVILHGRGGNGITTIEPWIKRLRNEFIIVCPEYPLGAWWTLTAENVVLELIRKIQAQYPTDHNRVFLAGLSNGAIGAYMIGMFFPDYFAGIVPIAGAITERYMHFLVNLNNTPIYSIQGQDDPFFPIQFSRRINQILSDMKYPVTYREHTEIGSAHGGHFLPESEIPALYDWLKTQKRNINPPAVRMTREENHLDRIQWARISKGRKLAALQIPGPGEEITNLHDGKIASLFATHKERNEFEIIGQNLLEYEIYLNSDQVDFDQPITVTSQQLLAKDSKLVTGDQAVSFFGKVDKDMTVLLQEYKARRDPYLLYDAKVKITFEKEIETAWNR